MRKAIRSFVNVVKSNLVMVEARLNYGVVVLNYSDFNKSSEHFGVVFLMEPENIDVILGNAVSDCGLS